MRSSITDGARRTAKAAVRAAAMATAGTRTGPDLVIIGAKRSGTTSLFRSLEQHPAMCPLVPSARTLPLRDNQKGVHYFDTNYDRSNRWYRSHFPMAVSRRRAERRHGPTFTAEASPYYLFHPLAARRAATSLPDTTFVVLLRDPVERTVSHWAEQTRNGVETLSLREALDAEDERLGDAADRLASGELTTSVAHEHQSYASQSEYAASLRRWFDVVERDRLLVFFFEHDAQRPTGVLDTITDHLGVARMPANTVREHRNAAPRGDSIDHDLERRLTTRFAPDVALLAHLLGVTPPWPRFADLGSEAPEAATGP